MKRFINFLKTDIKIINSYLLLLIILIILVCIGYSSYALFSFSKTSTNIIEGTVGKIKKSGADTLIKLTDNKDNSGLYTITHEADSTLQIGTNESITEYRYRGASPKNYVTFNNETWRIIGIFPTDDGTGKIENRIKIIKDKNVENIDTITYAYDKNDNLLLLRDNDINAEYLNKYDKYKVMYTAPTPVVMYYSCPYDWTTATLQTKLNTTYLTELTSEAQSMIENAKYYLGGYNGWSGQEHIQTPVQVYSYERKIKNTISNEFYYGTNPNSWIGKIGLMYVSDYGYASANCENKMLYSSKSSSNDLRACKDTNWLYNSDYQYTLPQLSSSNYCGFIIVSDGSLGDYIVYDADSTQFDTRPVLYLTSSVKITGGTGTSTDPYTFEL